MIVHILAIVVGFALLTWSADRFVIGAAATADKAGLSPLVIGLTVVAFGTSAPEMLVSAVAAWQGNPSLALGNALGSNIANTGLIIGVTALVSPLLINSRLLRREIPLLLAVMLVTLIPLWNGWLGRLEGLLLFAGLIALTGYMLWQSRRPDAASDPITAEYAEEIPHDVSLARAVWWLVSGLVVLLVSARLLVWAAVALAQAFGVSDLIIGLSIVALGTSLPELAASVAAVRRAEHDIAIGNVIGSNMFNLLGVVGLAGLIHPAAVAPEVLHRDYAVMAGITIAMILISRGLGPAKHIGRFGGLLLVLGYLGYQAVLYMTS